jgi:hypothetical protein
MPIRFIAAFAMAALMSISAQAGTKIDDPVTFVRVVYAKITTDRNYQAPQDIYTPRLAALFALEKRETDGRPSRMALDIWTNAMDYQPIKDVKISGERIEGASDRAVVTARFKNGSQKQLLQFYFEKTKDGWKLDDERSLTLDGWTLSLMLKYGWVSAN